MTMQGKCYIVTGGSSGIGAACVSLLAQRGAKVLFASNQKEEGAALESKLAEQGRAARFVFGDVTDEACVKSLIDQAASWGGTVDGVMANAGVWRQGNALQATRADLDLLMNVNVMGAVLLARHYVPLLEKRRRTGVLLITTSVAAHIGFPSHVLYCASKAAAESLVRTLAVDHAGVMRVAGLCPGTIDTPMLAATCAGWNKTKDEIYADVRKRIPVRRMGEPRDVAHAAAFLLSDEAGYINGTSITLDGGTMALPPW